MRYLTHKLNLKVATIGVLSLGLVLAIGTYVYASSTSNFTQTISAGTRP